MLPNLSQQSPKPEGAAPKCKRRRTFSARSKVARLLARTSARRVCLVWRRTWRHLRTPVRLAGIPAAKWRLLEWVGFWGFAIWLTSKALLSAAEFVTVVGEAWRN